VGEKAQSESSRHDCLRGFLAAHTYSDMTGQQLRLASREPSTYIQNLNTCIGSGVNAATEWRNLTWDAELPPGSYIVFRIRVGKDQAAAEQASWLEVATVPGCESPRRNPALPGGRRPTGAFHPGGDPPGLSRRRPEQQ